MMLTLLRTLSDWEDAEWKLLQWEQVLPMTHLDKNKRIQKEI